MAYENDYRKRILNFYYENGKTKILFQFNISSSTLYGWIKLKKEIGDLYILSLHKILDTLAVFYNNDY